MEDLDNRLIEKATNLFQEKDFRHISDLSVDQGNNAIVYIRSFADKGNVTAAHAWYLVCGKIKKFFIGFETDFEDGTAVATSNTSHA